MYFFNFIKALKDIQRQIFLVTKKELSFSEILSIVDIIENSIMGIENRNRDKIG